MPSTASLSSLFILISSIFLYHYTYRCSDLTHVRQNYAYSLNKTRMERDSSKLFLDPPWLRCGHSTGSFSTVQFPNRGERRRLQGIHLENRNVNWDHCGRLCYSTKTMAGLKWLHETISEFTLYMVRRKTETWTYTKSPSMLIIYTSTGSQEICSGAVVTECWRTKYYQKEHVRFPVWTFACSWCSLLVEKLPRHCKSACALQPITDTHIPVLLSNQPPAHQCCSLSIPAPCLFFAKGIKGIRYRVPLFLFCKIQLGEALPLRDWNGDSRMPLIELWYQEQYWGTNTVAELGICIHCGHRDF